MSLFPNALDYRDAGLKLTRLHGIVQGQCDCQSAKNMDPELKKKRAPCLAIGKHPVLSKWQISASPVESEILDIWDRNYQTTGIGWVLDAQHIVIDVDPRNGGSESLAKLEKDIGIKLLDVCTAVVKTGGNGLHYYFQKDPSLPLSCKMPKDYPGLDVKQHGGYVVIPGSIHQSGSTYEWYSAAKSNLEKLATLPMPIMEMLTRARVEARIEADASGIGDIDDINDMLFMMDANMEYSNWLKVGMAVHHATEGSREGLIVWDTWSQKGDNYRTGECEYKWHTFGKYSGAMTGIGTLVSMAKDCGWEPSYVFTASEKSAALEVKKRWDEEKKTRLSIPSVNETDDIDIYSPPGLLGKIYNYVYSCSPYDNKNLALAAALVSLGNVIGRRFYLEKYKNIQPNFIALCVAGAGCGKGPVLNASRSILEATGIFGAHNGAIISAKDVSDSLEENQYCFLVMDEFGQVLKQIDNAAKGGGSAHMEGIPKVIMESFTASSIGLSNRRKKEIKELWATRINTLKKTLKDNPHNEKVEDIQARLNRAKFMLENQNGQLRNPFISMITFSTPGTMVTAYNKEAAENGFLSRTMAFHENETNPRARPDFAGTPDSVPTGLLMALNTVKFRMDDCPFGRIDSYEQKRDVILIAENAQMLLDNAFEYFHALADEQKENGLESLVRRSKDNVLKVCIALGADLRAVTMDIARYAIKLVMYELNVKISRVLATENINSDDKEEREDGSSARLIELCSIDSGATFKHLLNRCKSKRVTRETLPKKIEALVKQGRLIEVVQGTKVKYKAAKMQ